MNKVMVAEINMVLILTDIILIMFYKPGIVLIIKTNIKYNKIMK